MTTTMTVMINYGYEEIRTSEILDVSTQGIFK